MSEPPKSSPWWDCFGCSGRPESPEPAMEEERREQPRAMPAPSHEPNPRARMPERTPEPQRTPEPERALELQRIAEPQRTPEPGDEAKKGSKLDYEALLKEGYDKAKELSMEGLVKGRMALERGLGLGQKPNAIPPAEATVHGPPRKVELGWHPVAGLAGKWFAEETGLGKMITEKIRAYPDPTQHWAVLVGDYCHQLWMDEKLDVIYNNERINRADWHTFEVGTTRFNDEALRQASEMVIHNMRQRRPAYNLISNNCQNFAVALLDAIHVGAQREFGTTFAIYQRATGRGRIMDLFEDHGDDRVNPDGRPPETTHAEAVNHAQQVMDENTQKVDTKAKASHRPLFH